MTDSASKTASAVAGRRLRASVFAAAALLTSGVEAQDASSAAPAAGDAIVASINPVAAGQDCNAAASQTQVSFDFAKPDFEIKQISLYVDGKGVPGNQIQQNWPRVTLASGLHPGRNTVEIVATGDNDRSIARQLTVLIGEPAQSGDTSPAVIDCGNTAVATAAPPPAVVAQPPAVVEQAPPTVIEQPQTVIEEPSVVYVDEPVYVYHEYPAYPVWPVFVPIVTVYIGNYPPPVWYAPYHHWHPWPPPAVSYYPAPPRWVPPPPPVVYHAPAPFNPPSNLYHQPWPITATPHPISGPPTNFTPPPAYNRGPAGNPGNSGNPRNPGGNPGNPGNGSMPWGGPPHGGTYTPPPAPRPAQPQPQPRQPYQQQPRPQPQQPWGAPQHGYGYGYGHTAYASPAPHPMPVRAPAPQHAAAMPVMRAPSPPHGSWRPH